MNPQEIVNEIINYITRCGGSVKEWYIGIAADPHFRLFSSHQVNEDADAWIYRQAPTHEAARNIENFLLRRYGLTGGTGGGNIDTKYVYAYRISPHTVE